MRPTIHPQLISDPFGDPGLYVAFAFERRAMLFDLGDLSPLPARRLLHVTHAFVSHAHMDHFAGFDRLLRVTLGRDKSIALAGPAGFIERVAHKLAAYTWNFVRSYEGNLAFDVLEVHRDGRRVAARLELRSAFECRAVEASGEAGGPIFDDGGVSVRAAVLDHQTPCLAFALEEKCHVNIWPNRLEAEGLPVGPWLRDLKKAVIAGAPDDMPIRIRWKEEQGRLRERELALGALKERVLSIGPGLTVGYVVDAVYRPDNVHRIVNLVRGADTLFIETPFLDTDAAIAARKFHLTARQAGEIARLAGAKRIVPFHFSPRYSGRSDEIVREAQQAFATP